LAFDTRFHGGVRPVNPRRCIEESLYHLAHVTRDLQRRRQRAAHYDLARPGLVAVGGGPLNETLYAPERFATRRPVVTPDEDQRILRTVLDARDVVTTPDRDVPIVSATEVASWIPPDPLDAQGYRARLRIIELDLRTDPGVDTPVVVEVRNIGSAPLHFRDSSHAHLRVATRLVRRDGTAPASDWRYTDLPCDIPVGEARVVDAVVSAPFLAGVYDLEASLQNVVGRSLEGDTVVGRSFEGDTTAGFLVATRWARFAR
jgi:hypothetical protein